MTVNFSSKNESTRFHFDESEPEAGWLDVRACNKKQWDIIEDQTVSEKKKFKRDRYVPIVKVNRNLQNELLWDYCITGWHGVAYDGKILECTKENKVMLLENSPQFMTFFTSCIEILEDIEVTQEKKRKNSGKQSSDSAGKSTAIDASISSQGLEKKPIAETVSQT